MQISELQRHVDSATSRLVDSSGALALPANLVVSSEKGPIPYLFHQQASGTTYLAYAYVVAVLDGPDSHLVVLAYYKEMGRGDFFLWCSDKYLEGKLDTAQLAGRVADATRGLPNAEDMEALLLDQAGSSPASARCNFAALSSSGKICAHVEAGLAFLKSKNPNFLTDLVAAFDRSGDEPAFEISETHMLPEELAFRANVLFEGDRGAGKTHDARKFARTRNLMLVELQGHEDVEASDMLGKFVQYKGADAMMQWVWMDGRISRAFRAAAKGERVVLLIDELLRIPQRNLSVLLSALSVDEGFYKLETGRALDVVDGVAYEETLLAPVKNLWVVATTNVGSEYAVDDIDPALAERFVVFRKDSTSAQLRAILEVMLAERNYPNPAQVLDRTLKFFEKANLAKTQGLLSRAPTTRTICRPVGLAKTEQDLVRALRSHELLWVGRDVDGKPNQSQLKAVEKLLSESFPKKAGRP